MMKKESGLWEGRILTSTRFVVAGEKKKDKEERKGKGGVEKEGRVPKTNSPHRTASSRGWPISRRRKGAVYLVQ